MSPKSAILISTKETGQIEIFKYFKSELNNLNFKIQSSYLCETKESLSKVITECLENYSIFLFTNKNDIACKILSEISGEKLVKSKHLASAYECNTLNDENLDKIAIPSSSQIFQIQNNVFIKYDNIFVLPGDLNSAKLIFNSILKSLLATKAKFENFEKHFILHCNQNGLKKQISDCLNKFDNCVEVKKYCIPKNNENCESHVFISSTNFSKLAQCQNMFQNIISTDMVMSRKIGSEFWERLELVKHEEFVEQAIRILENCFADYDISDVFLCFNGGKDCTVLLYLTCYVLNVLHPSYKHPLLCLYIQPEDSFEEIEQFVEQCKIFYNLEIIRIKKPKKLALEELLTQRKNLTACLMGLRRMDPYAENLTHFAMTDPDWPPIMRVHPILDWTYNNIWQFLLTCKIPYCELYDHGYTSLGSKNNTFRNDALKYIENGVEKFYPAYKLREESKERSNRFSKSETN